MRSLLLCLILSFFFSSLLYSQSFQLSNGGFEQWDGSGASDEPTFWNGFPSAKCDLKGFASLGCGTAKSPRHKRSDSTRPGSEGKSSCMIYATEAFGFIANGVITTGQIRIGSTEATSPDNYNITRTGDANFNQALTASPDSINFWARFVCQDTYQYARMNAVIHDNYDYRDPLTSDAGAGQHVVAKAIKDFQTDTQDWKLYSVPFNYNSPSDDPRYILLTFTTNREAGKGADGDALYIDDIEFIYNDRLKLLAVDGKDVDDFSPDVLEYTVLLPLGAEGVVTATAQSPRANVVILPDDAGISSSVVVTAGNKTREYKLNYIYFSEISDEICQGDSYNSNGFDIPVQEKAGIFNFEISEEDENGIKKLKKLKLTVNATYTDDFVDNIPQDSIQIPFGTTYDFHGLIISESGEYEKILKTDKSCDSIVKLYLTVSDQYLININASICEGQTYSKNGFNESQAGTYTQILTSVEKNCDSIVILTLNVNKSYPLENPIIISDTLTAGNKYDKNGFLYSKNYFENVVESFIFMDTIFSNVFLTNCDSVTVLKLEIFPPKVKNEDNEVSEIAEEVDKKFEILYSFNEHNKIVIKSDNEFVANEKYMYFIYDSYGRRVMSGNLRADSTALYLDELFSGIYIINIFKKSFKQALKFVVY